MSLLELYKSHENKECVGCSILKQNKPFHCLKDYLKLKNADILFLVDSFQYNGFEGSPLSEQTEELFNDILGPLLGNLSFTISASVKCPSVNDKNMDAESRDICRKYLESTIVAVQPKLIIPMGNLAFKMLLKKSGIEKHHGSEFKYQDIPVVPTYSLSILYFEPKYRDTIISDVSLALNKIIHKSVTPLQLDYTVVNDVNSLVDYVGKYQLNNTASMIAVDVETTGLNFLTDNVLTIAITHREKEGLKTLVVPYKHREVSFSDEDLLAINRVLSGVLSNPHNIKVLHNAKFDYKFFKRHGIVLANNIFDTAGMMHLIDEHQSTRLINLVKRYFPENLEIL